MKTKRRTEISFETGRVFVIHGRRGSALNLCAECAGQVKMVTPDEAAILARVGSRTIYDWIETKKLHFAETPEGLVLICLKSLLDSKVQP